MAAFLWDRAAGDWSWIIFTTSKSGYEKKRGEKSKPHIRKWHKIQFTFFGFVYFLFESRKVKALWKSRWHEKLLQSLLLLARLLSLHLVSLWRMIVGIQGKEHWPSSYRRVMWKPLEKKKELKKQGVSPEREIMLLLRKRARLFP